MLHEETHSTFPSVLSLFVEAGSLAGLLHLTDQLSKAIKEPLYPSSVLQTLLDRLLLPQLSHLHPERCNLQVDQQMKKNTLKWLKWVKV